MEDPASEGNKSQIKKVQSNSDMELDIVVHFLIEDRSGPSLAQGLRAL